MADLDQVETGVEGRLLGGHLHGRTDLAVAVMLIARVNVTEPVDELADERVGATVATSRRHARDRFGKLEQVLVEQTLDCET